ncbi:hypothetical protein ACFX11_024945 [Malus domestica]
MAQFVWYVTNNTATVECYNACQEALHNKGTRFNFMLPKTLHLTTNGNSELHIATLWQMLKPFWNTSTIANYILEIEFLWDKDIKVALGKVNATSSIFSTFVYWLMVEPNKRGFKVSLVFPISKNQVSILKAQVKLSSVFPSYMVY